MPQEQIENRIESSVAWVEPQSRNQETNNTQTTAENQPRAEDLSSEKILSQGPKNADEVLRLVENLSYEELRHNRLVEKYGEGFIGRFQAFLAGEIDSERIESKDASKSWWEKETIREVLISVFNRKNIYAAGAAVAVGILTGGIGVPVVGALIGGSLGRFGAEVFAEEEEKSSRQKLMEAERNHWSKLKELATSYRQANGEAKKSKLNILLDEYFLNNEASVSRTQFIEAGGNFTKKREYWDKVRNICQSLGGVAGLGGGVLYGQEGFIKALPSLGAMTVLGNKVFDADKLDSFPLAYCNVAWERMRREYLKRQREMAEGAASAQTPAPPIKTKEQTLGDKIALSRKFAMITLARIRSYIDLLNKDAEGKPIATTMTESDAIFNQKTRELIRDIVIHGMMGKDRETGRRVLRDHPDNDGDGCPFLMARAGFNNLQIRYVEQGQFINGLPNLDTGNRHGLVVEGIDAEHPYGQTYFIDHHGDETGTDLSATEITYETLIASGLLERTPELDKYVAFITHIDNLTHPDLTRCFQNSHRMVLGLYRWMSAEQLYNFFAQGGDPTRELSDEEIRTIGGQSLFDRVEKVRRDNLESLRNISIAENSGFGIDTPHGKALIDLDGKIKSVEAVFSKGYKVYIKWVPRENRFNISGWPREKLLPQGKRVRNMWLKPHEDRSRLTMKLGEVVRILTNGQAAPTGELLQFLQNELSGRELRRSQRGDGRSRERGRNIGRGQRRTGVRRAA